MKSMYVGILAGGSGSRLWPLSSATKPKQLLPFIHNSSLIEQAVQRVTALGIGKENIFVITNQEQEKAITQTLKDTVGSFVIEPSARNTAPAILLGCHHVYEQDPEAIVLFLPADHFIPEQTGWIKAVQQVLNSAQKNNNLFLIGLKPTYPATGYGYIQTKQTSSTPLSIIKFHEKPSLIKAQEYLTRHDMFWNIGIFAGTVKAFIQEFKQHTPTVYNTIQQHLQHQAPYSNIPSISMDYAIMEKTTNAMMIPASFTWYDVGNLTTFLSLQKHYNQLNNPTININGSNNLVSSKKKIIACVGVSNLCIIETEDTLLIVAQDQVEQVKEVVEQVKALEL